MESYQSSDEEFYDALEFEESEDQSCRLESQSMILTNEVSYHKTSEDYNSTSFFGNHKTLDFSSVNNLRTYKKPQPDFEGLKLVQEIELTCRGNCARWVTKFSPDSRFLVVSGDCGYMALFEVLGHRGSHSTLLRSVPSLTVPTPPISEIAWNYQGTQFLTACLDGSVKLWRPDKESHLSVFPHAFPVNSVVFHPHNSDYFVTASQDKILRLFKLSEKRIDGFYMASDEVNTIEYSINGNYLAAGLVKGQVLIYESRSTDFKLRLNNELLCRNRYGFKRRGRKVTGLSFLNDELLLITTNDSRLRLYKFLEGEMLQKYKGTYNSRFPLRGSFSHDFKHILCGSEKGKVFIWNTLADKPDKKNDSYEVFDVRKRKVVEYAMFAPENTVNLINNAMSGQKQEIKHIILCLGLKEKLRVFYNLPDNAISNH